MGFLTLPAFIGIPIIEIALFIQVGGFIGLWPTIILVIFTAIVGTSLLRYQGLSTLRRFQSTMQSGQMPLGPVFDGLCLVLAGAFLLTPGFFTDGIGFLLFVPPVRRALGHWLSMRIEVQATQHSSAGMHWPGEGPSHHPSKGDDGSTIIIDGDFEEVAKPNNTEKSKPSED